MMKLFYQLSLIIICLSIISCVSIQANEKNQKDEESDSLSYVDFFEEVYDRMDQSYYDDVPREKFDKFVDNFQTKILSQLKGKSNDYIRWRGAAYLVDFLKTEEDVFSAFYPPKPAKEYEETALGKKIDLGLKGELMDVGYKLTHVEPRSDAYEKGIRVSDVLLAIDGEIILGLSEGKINELLTPLEKAVVVLKMVSQSYQGEKIVEVVSKEYFKQTVFLRPVKIPGIYALQIERFNRRTGDDFARFMGFIKSQKNINGLILDLRGNPGGPPLAARQISSFFLPGGDRFAFFQKKGFPAANLDVPKIKDEFKYDGPMVILIDEKSGSAAELFPGVLQKKKRAFLMGVNSAGQVMLKSMFHFDDESMILLITSRGYHEDKSVFSFDGLTPDKYIKEAGDAMDIAAKYLYYINKNPEASYLNQ